MKILGFHFLTISQIKFLNKYVKPRWNYAKDKWVRGGKWTINKKTGLVDIKGNFNCSNFNCSGEGLTDFKGVLFGVVTGDFYCHHNKLTSLEGAPQEVGGDFDCSNNQLTSLKGAPQKVGGDFYCYINKLTSLEGAPQVVGGNFNCYNNKLTTLVGAPRKVGGYFSCSNNNLTSLVGAPQEVGRWFDCTSNNLTSLEGAPQKVGGHFNWDNNQISKKTLKLVLRTMQEKKVDYLGVLCILKGQIDSGEWNEMIRGYEDRITPEAIKAYSIVSRYSL